MMSFYKSTGLIGFLLIFISGLLAHPAWAKDDCSSEIDVNEPISVKEYTSWGRILIFGNPKVRRSSSRVTGRGQCSLCHDFDRGYDIGRGPNLFGIEERSRKRIQEWRYMTHPILVGSREPSTGIIKGANTVEEYLRESIKCPSCYIVKGYEYEDKNEPMRSKCPAAHLPPIGLSDLEINAIIAFLQSSYAPGNNPPWDYSKVTVDLPLMRDMIQARPFKYPCYSVQ